MAWRSCSKCRAWAFLYFNLLLAVFELENGIIVQYDFFAVGLSRNMKRVDNWFHDIRSSIFLAWTSNLIVLHPLLDQLCKIDRLLLYLSVNGSTSFFLSLSDGRLKIKSTKYKIFWRSDSIIDKLQWLTFDPCVAAAPTSSVFSRNSNEFSVRLSTWMLASIGVAIISSDGTDGGSS